MSQCADVLAVLVDGDWHTVSEIHRRAGFSRLNSRVSELRSRGHLIECERVAAERPSDSYRYRLVGSLDAPQAISAPPSGAERRAHPASPGAAADPHGQGCAPPIEQPDGQLAIAEVAA